MNESNLLLEQKLSLLSFYKLYGVIGILYFCMYIVKGLMNPSSPFMLSKYEFVFQNSEKTLKLLDKLYFIYSQFCIGLNKSILINVNLMNNFSFVSDILFFLIFATIIYIGLVYHSTNFLIFEDKLVLNKGFFKKRSLEIPLKKITGMDIYQTKIEKLFNYGTAILANNGNPFVSIKNIKKPYEFRELIKNLFLGLYGMNGMSIDTEIDKIIQTTNKKLNGLIKEEGKEEKDFVGNSKNLHLLNEKTNFNEVEVAFKQYTFKSVISKGSCGVVYLAQDNFIKRNVAIKVLNKESEEENFDKFLTEAENAAKTQQANILTIYEAGKENDVIYLITEYFPFPTLKELIYNKNKISFKEKYGILYQILLGLYHIHKNNVIHLDLKPENILYDTKTRLIKIGDFGISRLRETNSLVQTQTISGTPTYMPPESFEGKSGEQTDIFAFGVTAYELLTKELPFKGSDLISLIKEIDSKKEKPLTDFNIHPEIAKIVHKCLEKKQEDRYKKVKEILRDLRDFKKDNGLENE